MEKPYQRYRCVLCCSEYDEKKGVPEEGVAPGTRWEDTPPNMFCRECAGGPDGFEPVGD